MASEDSPKPSHKPDHSAPDHSAPDHCAGRYSLDDLLTLMDRLRDEQFGCPWDLKQSFATIVPHTIEETYEVVDAIERQDWPHVKDELGDLLFQVVFYARLGKEQQLFDWNAVVDNVVRKLLRRHPHVFPEGTLESRIDPENRPSEEWISATWERIKAEEKALEMRQGGADKTEDASLLSNIPHALPALQRALKIQKKVSRVGFDWSEVSGVLAKVREELQELEDELQTQSPDQDRITAELGDLFFACSNLARFIRVDPEMALRGTNARFERRFRRVEELVASAGYDMEECSEAYLDECWNQAKREENNSR